MKKRLGMWMVAVCVALAWAGAWAQGGPNDIKKVAVFPLKTAAGLYNWWGGGFDPGAAMTESLQTAFANSNKFALFDRENLDKIAQEQNLGTAGEVTPETAAKIGKLVGIRYIITGAVVEFGEEKRSGIGAGGFNVGGINIGGGGGGTRVRIVAEVHVTDVNTGLISAGIRGEAEAVANHGGLSLSGFGVGAGGGSEEFVGSKLGEAMRKCADSVVAQMEQIQFKEVPQTPVLEAAIIDISGTQITLNVGNKQGVVVGMKFAVTRARTITDPTSGALRTLHSPVGTLTVTAVDDDTCTCKAAPGANPFKLKDVAKMGGD